MEKNTEKIDINSLIHNKEKLLYSILVVLNLLIIIGVIAVAFLDLSKDKEGLTVLLLPIIVIYQLGKTYANTRVYSVKLSRNQFGDVYELADSFADRLGMDKTPEIYLRQQNGVLNAFASTFFSRNYIQINAEIFEVAYNENKDLDSLAFIIGHELSHIKLKHTNIWTIYATLFSSMIPILGSTLSRAREYSCDNIAKELVPQGKSGLMLLVVGRKLYKMVNLEEYIEESNSKGVFIWLTNALASHPVLTKRIRFIQNVDKPKLF